MRVKLLMDIYYYSFISLFRRLSHTLILKIRHDFSKIRPSRLSKFYYYSLEDIKSWID